MSTHEAAQIMAWHRSGQSAASIAAFCELIKFKSAIDLTAIEGEMAKRGERLIAAAKKIVGDVT